MEYKISLLLLKRFFLKLNWMAIFYINLCVAFWLRGRITGCCAPFRGMCFTAVRKFVQDGLSDKTLKPHSWEFKRFYSIVPGIMQFSEK